MTAKVVGAVQARLASSRLPRKALLPLLGKPVVRHVLERLAASPGVDQVVLATSDAASDQELVEFGETLGIQVSRGPVDDIVGRLHRVALDTGADFLVRAWGDCPCLDPELIGRGLAAMGEARADFLYIHSALAGAGSPGNGQGTFPYGLNFQIFRPSLLDLLESIQDPFVREFPHELIRSQPERIRSLRLESEGDYSDIQLTLDYPEDVALIQHIFAALQRPDRLFGYREIASFLRAGGDTRIGNRELPRNQEYFHKKAIREGAVPNPARQDEA